MNDIIKQALSIPSFTLVIVNYSDTINKNTEIENLKKLDDKRIIVLDQGNEKISTFKGFVENVMPDLYEEKENETIAETMNKLYPCRKDDNGETTNGTN